jgi:hypothetical protein
MLDQSGRLFKWFIATKRAEEKKIVFFDTIKVEQKGQSWTFDDQLCL